MMRQLLQVRTRDDSQWVCLLPQGPDHEVASNGTVLFNDQDQSQSTSDFALGGRFAVNSRPSIPDIDLHEPLDL